MDPTSIDLSYSWALIKIWIEKSKYCISIKKIHDWNKK